MPFSSALRRIASMTSGEIALRLGQALAKRIDSLGIIQPSFDFLAADQFANTSQFFFEKAEISQRIYLIREHVPGFEINVLDRAEQILTRQFSLLGYQSLHYGKEIDWQLDIVNGKRAPLKPWPKINYLDFNEVGDSKVTWELSRHQFLVTLAKAWLLTGEERYVRELETLYYDWHRKNPYPLGLNWASSLEVAFRSLSWIWVLELLGGCELATQVRHHIAQALAFNAWYIRRYLSTYFSPNTHLLGEGVALFFIGTLYPSLPSAPDWRETGLNILMEHALNKVLKDGAYFEQSTYYHVYALDFFLHARILAERNGTSFPNFYDDVLKKMLEYLAFLCQAGPPPRFGDDDGGRVFDGRRNQAEHLLDPLVIGAALYRVNAFKQPGVAVTEEMLWLLGEEGLQGFSGYPEWKSHSSVQFPQTGIYIFHGGESSRSQVVLDAGPLGGGSGGHGHADALSLTLNLDGKPLLVDPGACSYVGPGSDRNSFRTTGIHNTVVVDSLSQAEPQTPFSWFRWPEVKVEAIAFTPEFEFIAAFHDGYSRAQPPVTHRRTLFAPHEGFWFVLDELMSDGPHDYALHWHLAPDAKVEQRAGDRWAVTMQGSELQLLTVADRWLPTVESGWFSPAYGTKRTAPVVSFTKKSFGNETIATVLWAGNIGTPPPALSTLNPSSRTSTYYLKNSAKRSIFIFGDGTSTINIDGWESDARFLYGTLDANGHPFRVIVIQGTIVRHCGKILRKPTNHPTHFVWERMRFSN